MMQVRCQRCGWMMTLGREAIALAIAEAQQGQEQYYSMDCPHCRRTIKVQVAQLRRGLPADYPIPEIQAPVQVPKETAAQAAPKPAPTPPPAESAKQAGSDTEPKPARPARKRASQPQAKAVEKKTSVKLVETEEPARKTGTEPRSVQADKPKQRTRKK